MVPINETDWINSCKSNLDLGGGFDILDILFDIDSNEGIVRYLADFNCSLWYIWELFIFVIELTLFSIEVLCMLSRYALYHLLFRNFMNMHVVVSYIYVWFHSWVLRCMLDLLGQNTCCVLYFYANFDVLW